MLALLFGFCCFESSSDSDGIYLDTFPLPTTTVLEDELFLLWSEFGFLRSNCSLLIRSCSCWYSVELEVLAGIEAPESGLFWSMCSNYTF